MRFKSTKCRSCWQKSMMVDRMDMLEILETGKFTLREIAEKYGLTRERVRQIWKKNMGNGYDRHYRVLSKIKKEKYEKFLNTIKFVCLRCKKKVANREKYSQVYCSVCRKQMRMTGTRRNYRIIRVCGSCGKDFSPWFPFNSPSQRARTKGGRFCSMKCYIESPDFKNMQRMKPKKFTEEKIIGLVCNFLDKNSRLPKFSEINSRNLGVSNMTIYNYFGSLPELWNKALLKHFET